MENIRLLIICAVIGLRIGSLNAQAIFSVNAVGYINKIAAPGLNLVGLQLDNDHGNTVSSLFTQVPDGMTIYKVVEGSFTSNVYRDGQWEAPDDTIAVGEGFFVSNPAKPVTVTFVGEVRQGDLTNPIPAGLSMHCSIVPEAGKLTQNLGLRLAPFDNVYLFRNGALQVFTFLSDDAWTPFEPTVDLAESFMINAAEPMNWVTHFEVNPLLDPAISVSRATLSSHFLPATSVDESLPVGTVNFANGAAQVNASVTLTGNNTGVEGPDWQAELLVQTETNFVSIAGPVPFQTGALAGYFFAGSVSVPGTEPGQSETFKVRIHNVASQFSRDSEPVTVILGGGIIPPPNLIGLAPQQVPPPVMLSISASGNQIVLSWPNEAANMTPQFCASFPRIWQDISGLKITNATSISITLDMISSPQCFRLISR